MSFLYPLGFLVLLAIPPLVIIYIIKSKYTEQVIPSTYLWNLSERFLKRKNPVSKVTGIISLILQIFAVILIALAVAHPVFTLRGKAADYCYILDCSGSMNILQGRDTRLEDGKKEVQKLISSSAGGSTYTLITAGNSSSVVFKDSEDKKTAINMVKDVAPEYADGENSLNYALATAQSIFDANKSCKLYLITDKDVNVSENVTVIKVGGNAYNYALTDVKYRFEADGSTLVTGKAFAYGSDGAVTVKTFVDGSSSAAATADLQLAPEEGKEFSMRIGGSSFSSLRVAIENKDSLALDSEVYLYNERSGETCSALIVSDTPNFLKNALSVLPNVACDVVTPEEYAQSAPSGYGVYMYDSYSPDELPTSGAVWFINPVKDVEGSGFYIRGREELSGDAVLEYSSLSSSKVDSIIGDCDVNEQSYVKKYVNCVHSGFTNILNSDGKPMLFVGANEYGNREVVFSFDFHWSDFPVSNNYLILINNLINYTFPSLVDGGASYYCGDDVLVNVLANCSQIKVTLPQGGEEFLDTSSESCEYRLTEAGVYTFTATIGGRDRNVNLYSQLPETERKPASTLDSFVIGGEAENNHRDGKYEDLLYLFIILAVIVVADWALYCYEQYQLR